MDRYIYDELANLPLSQLADQASSFEWSQRSFRKPTVAYILDADPDAARARKPEYPVDFLHLCRSAYLQLARMLGINDRDSSAYRSRKPSAKSSAPLQPLVVDWPTKPGALSSIPSKPA